MTSWRRELVLRELLDHRHGKPRLTPSEAMLGRRARYGDRCASCRKGPTTGYVTLNRLPWLRVCGVCLRTWCARSAEH